MKNTPSLLLLLLLLTGGPGAWPCPALAHQCPADLNISDPEGVANITTGQQRVVTASLYVRPGPGFQGISLLAEGPGGGGEQLAAWFPMKDTCVQEGAEWWEVRAQVGMSYNTRHNKLHYNLVYGKCLRMCSRVVTFRGVSRLHIAGHGTSSWVLNTRHAACRAAKAEGMTDEVIYHTCQAPPPIQTHRTSADPTTPTPTNTPTVTPTPSATPTSPATPTRPVRCNLTLCREPTLGHAEWTMVVVMAVLTVMHVAVAVVGLWHCSQH